MVWALLAILGIPIWLIVGALMAGYANRRNFEKTPGVFPLRMRTLPSQDGKWSGKQHARWIHDVVLVNKGFAKVRTTPHGIKRMAGTPRPLEPSDVKGLGDQPMSLVLVLDDSTEVEIAFAAKDLSLASGPFGSSKTGEPS